MEPFAQSSLYKRKSSRGASLASDEEKEKLKHGQDKEKGVSWNKVIIAKTEGAFLISHYLMS